MHASAIALAIVYPDISGLALVQVEVGIIPWKMNGQMDARICRARCVVNQWHACSVGFFGLF